MVPEIKHAWGNGGRWLLIAFVAWFAVTTSGAVFLGLLFVGKDPLGYNHNPLELQIPQQIVNLADEPFAAGDTLIVLGTKCNRSTSPLRVDGSNYWKQISPSTQTVPRNPSGSGVLQPGCNTKVYLNEIPEALTPGRWRLEGENCTTSRDWCAVWFTDVFEVGQ